MYRVQRADVNSGGLSRMISDVFFNKMFYINILILIAFTKQMLSLMYLYILIWKRQVATNDIQICQTTYNAYMLPIEWMKSLTNNIIMCGHNSKAFDCVHFIKVLVFIKVVITEFHKVIFADTLPFYELSTDRLCRKENKLKLLYSQEAMFHDIVGGSYTGH